MPYYYEHTNGEIIRKTTWVVDSMGAAEYFDSPFVVRWWFEADPDHNAQSTERSGDAPNGDKTTT